MASENNLVQLRNVITDIRSLEEDAITRPNIGDLSFKDTLKPYLDKLNKKMEFIIEYAPGVHDNNVSNMYSILDNIFHVLKDLCEAENDIYPSRARDNMPAITEYINNIDEYWPPFVTAAIEAKGFLEDESIKKAYIKAIGDMEKQSSSFLDEISQKSEEAINSARELAEEIETKARRTATGISVDAAQEQFREAQDGFNMQVYIWSGISLLFLSSFIGLAMYLWFQDAPIGVESIIYYTAIRLTALGALGAIATFALRVLRAHLHMRQQNLHRQRVANSIEAFVESAVTEQHRDAILSYLVQAVAEFGASGLVQDKEDHVTPSRLVIDPVTKIISPDPPKGS